MKRHTRYKPKGWTGESYRHYLAAKGIKTKHGFEYNELFNNPDISQKIQEQNNMQYVVRVPVVFEVNWFDSMMGSAGDEQESYYEEEFTNKEDAEQFAQQHPGARIKSEQVNFAVKEISSEDEQLMKDYLNLRNQIMYLNEANTRINPRLQSALSSQRNQALKALKEYEAQLGDLVNTQKFAELEQEARKQRLMR